jgi:hypothetical protein
VREKIEMGLSAFWNPAVLTQKSDWQGIFRSLTATEKQVEVLTRILTFIRDKGQPTDYFPLTRHGSSSRFWPNRFVSTYAIRQFFEELAADGICSYRYAWDGLNCLIVCGFVESNVTVPARGRKLRGYCFSDKTLRFFNNIVHILPKLWVSARRTESTERG